MAAFSAIQHTQRLQDALSSSKPPSHADLRAMADDIHTAILSEARLAADVEARTRVQMDTLRTEINSELIDREANAARIAERQQFLFQRAAALPGQLGALERAVASAAYVEAALVALCPHVNPPLPGCAHVAE